MVLMEAGYLNAVEFRNWQERAQHYMSGPSYILASIWQGFRASHFDGPDDHAAKDAIYAHMVAKFANHPENPCHCPGQGYDEPLLRFGSEESDAAANISEADLEALLPAADIDVPVLLLAGECNDWIGQLLQSKHVPLFANARLEVIDDAEHAMLTDNPDATLAVIDAFLDGES